MPDTNSSWIFGSLHAAQIAAKEIAHKTGWICAPFYDGVSWRVAIYTSDGWLRGFAAHN